MKEKKPINIILITAFLLIIIIVLIKGVTYYTIRNRNLQNSKEQSIDEIQNSLNKLVELHNLKSNENISNNDETKTENERVYNLSNIEWEKYPSDITKKNVLWIFGAGDYDTNEIEEDLESSSEYNLMKKTIYSLSKKYEDACDCFFSKIIDSKLVLGDSTEIVEFKSNYKRYCYENNNNKYTDKIKYSIAIFNEMYHPNAERSENEQITDLNELVRGQYNKLMADKGKTYIDEKIIPERYYYEIPKLLIMNGNNDSEEEYKNNARAKKIRVIINGEKEYIFDLKDTNRVQIFDINYKQNTVEKPVSIEIEVLETYDGEKTSDVYISDVQFGITSNIPQGR